MIHFRNAIRHAFHVLAVGGSKYKVCVYLFLLLLLQCTVYTMVNCYYFTFYAFTRFYHCPTTLKWWSVTQSLHVSLRHCSAYIITSTISARLNSICTFKAMKMRMMDAEHSVAGATKIYSELDNGEDGDYDYSRDATSLRCGVVYMVQNVHVV